MRAERIQQAIRPEKIPVIAPTTIITPQKNSAFWDARSARFRGHPKENITLWQDRLACSTS